MSVSFNKLGSFGRLGNQLFQIASTIGIGLKNGHFCQFPKWEYEKYFINQLPGGSLKGETIKEKNFHFDEVKLEENGFYNLEGYFQSEQYFDNCKDIIKEQFTFKPEFVEKTKAKFDHFDRPTIAIHIRRGDYVGNQAHHNLSIKYYLNALEKLDWGNSKLLFFSDDQEFCKWHFSCLPNAYFSPCNEIEDLCLMSLCDDFIIANSSFSWWGAYLGEKRHSNIIRPKDHFAGTLLRHDIKDLYPERWTVIDEEKIDLNDLTFVIPVAFDHNDRKNNLNSSIYHLYKTFETNIKVIEQGGIAFCYTKNFADYSRFNSKEFHRTKMINDSVKESETPFCVNWDADMILNPVQIWYSAQLLRSGQDIVYPYIGTFNHIERSFLINLLENHYNLIGKEFRHAKESFGGAIFFNKESFLKAGGENENFISFGPEDAERYHRFIKLGLKVCRVNGPIYHMDHFRGINSSKTNPFIESNRAEWHKVRQMSMIDLETYVNTWKWKRN
jgi:hypothetical protein